MEYHKIETLFVRDEHTHRVRVGEFKSRCYALLNEWWTEKVDGTNIRIVWKDGKIAFGGRTDNASIPADLVKWLYENVTVEKVIRALTVSEAGPAPEAVIYGEGYGAGIQKGGGDYSPEKKVILYDVMIPGAHGWPWWLNWANVQDVAKKLELETVPFVGVMSLEQATEKIRAGFKSRCAVNEAKAAEGLVGRPEETLFDKKGHRLIVKLKTKDF